MKTIRIFAALALMTWPALAQQGIVAPRLAAVTQPPPSTAPGDASAPTAPGEADAGRRLTLDNKTIPLGGVLKDSPLWAYYKQRFVTASGRVVDTGNELISHSEGQGYGMLLAVAANDRSAFNRIWGWTRANLMVRDDQLIAWRWTPNHRPAVSDMNDASDGDILVAWALTEAAELWGDAAFRSSARRIAVEVGRKVVLFKTKQGALLLPAVAGFSTEDRPDGPVLNLSYYVFPAFARLPIVAPELDWAGLSQTGLDLIKATRFGPARLPSDWISGRDGDYKPAEGFPPQFSYNSIRIPLYLAWAGYGEWEHYQDFYAWASKRRGQISVVDVKTGAEASRFSETGYANIAALLLCALDQTAAQPEFAAQREGENYYPATLQLLTIIAARMRYPSCLGK